ncbi:UNVERIFIED_CONTAM: hypothetical protein NCL1_44813 [Trichonephila clavipes]
MILKKILLYFLYLIFILKLFSIKLSNGSLNFC